MSTPQKPTQNQIGTPISKSKFEDSPLFSYISNLSPIKPVKSTTYNSMSFAASPSVLTSSNAISQRDPQFFQSNPSFDPLEPIATSRICSTTRDEIRQPWITSERGTGETSITPSEVVATNLQEMYDPQKKHEDIHHWEDMISDANQLLMFSSAHDSAAFRDMMQSSSNPVTRSSGHMVPTIQPNSNNFTPHNPNVMLHSQAGSNLYRGTRRRCLDFEVPGKKRDGLADKRRLSYNEPFRRSSSQYPLPSIGLHLNALAMASMGIKTSITHDYSISGKIQINLPGSNSLVISQDSANDASANPENETDEDVSKASVSDELKPNNSKKKRLKFVEEEGEEGCKRCKCKKSKCLKLYCECFAAGVYCIGTCSCVDCHNRTVHEDTVLATRKQIESRNPSAFSPKVIMPSDPSSDAAYDGNKTPASARHKRGCNCKKSHCLKKYCECYQGGVGCSASCRCEGCKNTYGHKHGEQDKENKASENSGTSKTLQNPEVFNRESEHLSIDRPLTPISIYSSQQQAQLLQYYPGTGSTFELLDEQSLRASDFEINAADITVDTPEILQRSPIKAVSPNSKRISPPQLHTSESILGKRSSVRKLILPSIPPFPSLTPKR